MPCSRKCSSSACARAPSKRRSNATHAGSGWRAPAIWSRARRSTASVNSGRVRSRSASTAAHSVRSPMSSSSRKPSSRERSAITAGTGKPCAASQRPTFRKGSSSPAAPPPSSSEAGAKRPSPRSIATAVGTRAPSSRRRRERRVDASPCRGSAAVMRAAPPRASLAARVSASCGIADDIARRRRYQSDVTESKSTARWQRRDVRPLLTGLGRLPIAPADPMKFEYIPVLAMLALSALVPGLFLAVSALFGPRRPSAVKGEPFECGNVSSGPAWGRFSVKFYLTAILFIVFDVEVVFLYPWALLFRRLGLFGFIEMMIFIVVLTLGLVYVWRKGALEWD